ncbi:MAG: PorV/PorQ family protein [Candidatus Tenebribacter burtonii]|nr:PorV/PorQ family protein [Candidatus Tenebribacter burtonii]
MLRINKILMILIIFSLTVILSAETSGEYGFQLLKIASGAEGAAQAGTGAFSSGEAYAFMLNPTAGLFAEQRAISIAQNYWIFDTKLNSAGYVNTNGKTSFGVAYRYLDYGTLINTTDNGTITGEFHPMDLIFSLNFGYRITPNQYAGINANALYEKIDTSSSYGYTFDIGYTYLSFIQGQKFSAAIKNLGQTSAMENETIDLPISFELGVIQKFNINIIKLFTEFKMIKHIDDDEFRAVFGTKIKLNRILDFKLGYKLNFDAENFTAGFGINLKKIAMDYAYVPFEYHINDVHVIGLTYKF